MNTPRQIACALKICLGVFLVFPIQLFGQPSAHSLTLFGTTISESRIYLSPQAFDQSERNRVYDFGGLTTVSFAYRHQLSSSSLLQFRAEYLNNQEQILDQIGTPLRHGYEAAALEASALFQLPLGGDAFRLCMGGGGGFYLATRMYSVAGVDAGIVRSIPAVDIHVLISAEYFFSDSFSLKADVLFRDPVINTENAFPVSSVTANGFDYPLKTEPFRSTVNLNGNVYMLGLGWYF